MADLYEQYLIFRPEWLDSWQKGQEVDLLSNDSKWQAKLWQQLIKQLAYNPVELLNNAIANITITLYKNDGLVVEETGVEETGVGKEYPFSGEKLSPILTVYKAKDFNEAKIISNKILHYQGIGHSIGIHSKKEDRILELGLELPVCRVIVNQAHTFATGGSFNNGLPFSLSMGCGTWQKNTIDNNLNYKHFLNITKISKPIEGKEPSLRDFFEEYCAKYDPDELTKLN